MLKKQIKLFIGRFGLYLSWLVAMIATFGSLYASQILKLEPCVFCWYQRIMMFPLVIILGMGVYRTDKKIIPYVIALPLIGALIAFIQTFFSYFNITTPVCGSECIQESTKLFGLIDYSIASFFSFMAIYFLLFFTQKFSK